MIQKKKEKTTKTQNFLWLQDAQQQLSANVQVVPVSTRNMVTGTVSAAENLCITDQLLQKIVLTFGILSTCCGAVNMCLCPFAASQITS